MKIGRGKAVAIGTLVVGLGVLTAAAFAFKDRILGEWYLWKLESRDATNRKVAVKRLGELGTVRALPKIAAMLMPLAETNNDVRNAAASAMGKIAPREAAIPYLVPMLKDQDTPEYRRFAAWALGEIGRSAGTAVPALREALQDPHEPARRAAAEALKKIRGE